MKSQHATSLFDRNAPNPYLDGKLKRLLDILFASAGIVFFAPFWLIASICIKWEDRGPVLFKQPRLGRHRREFEIRKLRTMKDGTVTRVGHRLRGTGLDETAQFLSVLQGEMSMVGPRPLTRRDVERIGWTGEGQDARFRMKPGITGLAQLYGGRSAAESYELDMRYRKRAGFFLDIKLVALSFLVNIIGKERFRRIRFGARRSNFRPLPTEMRIAPPLRAVQEKGPVMPYHALLLNPFYPKDPHSSFGKHVLTPSLALTAIAGASPKQWKTTYWDENLLNGPPPSLPLPQVVGITVHLTFADRAYALADWYRKMGSVVILGGLHVMSCPEEAAPHADALAIGDGVQLWPEILNDVTAGTLKPVYRATFCRAFNEDPPPNRSILPRRSFLTVASINATRGCKNRCRFCYMATRGIQMPYRKKNVDRVVEEIRQTKESYIVFTDNNLGSDKEYLRELCRALEPLNIIWSAAVSIDVTDEPSLIRAMALSGCTGVFVGFESLSNANLTDAKKRTPLPDEYARRASLFHQNGIQVNASFVFGFDHDGPEVFAKTVEWIEKNRLECATFHILTPYPGTPLFNDLDKAGRLRHKDWQQYDTAHVVFEPARMSAEELFDGYAFAYQRLFSHRSIWKRRPSDWRAVVPYLAMSYLYKRANGMWRFLIKTNLVNTVWSPLIGLTRRRHLQFRKQLAAMPLYPQSSSPKKLRSKSLVSAGV